MPFNIRATLQAIQSYLEASGYFVGSQVSEPKQPPPEGFYAAVYMSAAGVNSLTLTGTIERHLPIIRVYRQMLAEPAEDIEFGMAEVISKVASDLIGEYDLGATIRNVDVGGQTGAPMSATWGYVDVGGAMFRIVDLIVPLIVDDSATLAP